MNSEPGIELIRKFIKSKQFTRFHKEHRYPGKLLTLLNMDTPHEIEEVLRDAPLASKLVMKYVPHDRLRYRALLHLKACIRNMSSENLCMNSTLLHFNIVLTEEAARVYILSDQSRYADIKFELTHTNHLHTNSNDYIVNMVSDILLKGK